MLLTFFDAIEIHLKRLLRTQSPTLWQKGWLALLWLISLGYRLGLIAHQSLYRFGLLKKERGPLLTISVGNIICGGSGKTPIVAMLAREFGEERVVIVSRSYRAQSQAESVMSNGNGPRLTPQDGDEAYMLAEQLPKSQILVGKKKVHLVRKAAQTNAKIVIVDDGFQHYALERDEDVITIAANDPLGGGFFLPRGRLRDSPKRLKEASLVIVQKTSTEDDFQRVVDKLSSYTSAPIVGSTYLASAFDEEKREVDLSKRRVAAFCGIADPEAFFSELKRRGACLVKSRELPDHRALSILELQQFAQEAYDIGCEFLICTEKDRVKIRPDRLPLPLITLRIEARVVYNRNLFENWLAGAKNKGHL